MALYPTKSSLSVGVLAVLVRDMAVHIERADTGVGENNATVSKGQHWRSQLTRSAVDIPPATYLIYPDHQKRDITCPDPK